MSDDKTLFVISASVVTDTPMHATKAAEVLARAAAGLLLDGIQASLTMGIPVDDDEDEDATTSD